MKKKEETVWQKVLLTAFMLIASISSIGAAAYMYGKSFRDIFVLLLVVTACFGISVFSLVQSDIFGTLHYDNGKHYIRFVIIFLISTAACDLLPLLPDTVWAVPSLALGLALFSNTVTGIISYAGLLGVCSYFASKDLIVFIIYFLVGVIFTILFEKLDDDYKTGIPMFIATLLYVIVTAAGVVFQSYGVITVDMLVMPVMNIFITFILMLAILRIYCAVAIDKEKGGYILINDQEYKMLAKYKDEDKQLYYNAIHTAYFAEKTARTLHMDVDVAKNGGYYHRIMVSECKKQEKSLEEVCKNNKFPPKAVQLLQEYNYKSQPMKMKETVAVYIADSVVSSIMYIIDKQKSGGISLDDKSMQDFGKIAVAVVRRKIDSGVLNKSDISLSDLEGLENIYAGEKLYYDFLRRE